MIFAITYMTLTAWIAESAVLDPALYLIPSPPLMLSSDNISPGELWTQALETRTDRVTRAVSDTIEKAETTSSKVEAAAGRMFWPRFAAPEPVLGVHIPLTFSLSGSYGKTGSLPATVIGNTYSSVSGIGTGITSSIFGKSAVASSYGRSGLAGSSYGTYGTSAVRVYGGDNVASWSGWGNGKWGHYGKG